MNTGTELSQYVTNRLAEIHHIVDQAIDGDSMKRIVGEEVLARIKRSDTRGVVTVIVRLALFSDCLSVAERAVTADGKVTEDELDLVFPFARQVAPFFARSLVRYRSHEDLKREHLLAFLSAHAEDSALFGGSSKVTGWLGLEICRRVGHETKESEALSIYEGTVLRILDDIVSLGGVSERELEARNELVERLGITDRFEEANEDLEKTTGDPRLAAFLSPDAPEVFHAIAHQSQMWEADPFDVETIHASARREFERLVDRAQDDAGHGRILLVLGDSGSGKTHLMRTFRTFAHRQRLGFTAYLQMSTRAEHYDRYVLLRTVDSLEPAYDKPEVQDSSLVCLSTALVESIEGHEQEIDALANAALSEDELSQVLSTLADALVQQPKFEAIDLDVLRVMLSLHRRDAPLTARAVKYLRCEALGERDRRMLGDVAPRSGAEQPTRMIEQLGRLIESATGGSLVLLVDQLEDIFNLDDASARFVRAMDVLREVADHVPSAVVVVSCLEDFYEDQRKRLTRAVLDRLEKDPEPVRLGLQRRVEEIEALVACRLEHLYEQTGVRHREEEPIYPFTRAQLVQLNNMRTRDVLEWCRNYRAQAIQAGAIEFEHTSEPPAPTPVPAFDFEQRWTDFAAEFEAQILDSEDDIAAAIARTLGRLGVPTNAVGRFVEIGPDGGNVVMGVCNKGAQGGWLTRQIGELEKRGAARRIIVVRCSDFPKRGVTGERIGEVIAKGGECVVLQDADQRAFAAFESFMAMFATEPGFAEWTKAHHPLAGIDCVRAALLVRPDLSAPAPMPVEKRPRAKPEQLELPRKTAPEPTAIRVGRTRGLAPQVITMPMARLVRHAGFLGSTGSGKTTVVLNLIEQALLQGVPALLVDRKGDLAGYASDAFRTMPLEDRERDARRRALVDQIDVRVFTPREPRGRPLALPVIPSGMQELASHEQSKVARHAAASLGAMMDYKENQADRARLGILAKAIELLGSRSDSDAVRLEDLIELIAQREPLLVAAIGRLDPKHFGKLVDHLETLRLNAGDLLSGQGERLSAEKLFETNAGRTPLSVISTKFLGDLGTVQFWVSRLLVELGRWASRNPSDRLQALVMFDEADMYLPAQRKPPTKEPMQDLLKRARSAGVGILLATQSPGDFDYRCRDNINTWFVGRIAEKTALDKMKPLLGDATTNISSKLATARTGQFFELVEGRVTELDADRSALDTAQLPEDELVRLAHDGLQR